MPQVKTLNPTIGDVGGTDLGFAFETPTGEIGFVFGDTFGGGKPAVGGPNWRSPVMLISKTRDGSPITFDRAARDGKQLIDYAHNNPEFSTVLPTDAITIHGVMYMHVMFTAGLGNEKWCEVLTSVDGNLWKRGKRLDANNNGRGRIMVTFDIKPGSDWVDIFTTTGLRRDQSIFRYRCLKDRLADYDSWEGWGWNGTDWGWGRTPSIVLRGKYGELSFRYIQGNAVLSFFDMGAYNITALVGKDADADWTKAPRYIIETGQRLPQLYGGYVHPDSKFDGKFIFIVSQWNTVTNNPYRAIQYEALLRPVAPIDNTKRTDIVATTSAPAPTPGGNPVPKPAFDLRVQISPNKSSRGSQRSRVKGLHTQQGNGTAASLGNYCCNPNSGVSYHFTVDNNRNVVRLVPSDQAAWSVGNANGLTTNLCFAGSFVEWTRQEWLDKMGDGIDIAAYLLVVECLNDGHAWQVRSVEDLKNGLSGQSDHNGINLGLLRAPGHTDVGPNFPWDVYAKAVNNYGINGIAEAPVRNLINECAAANTWLGKRVTEGEGVGKDDGRWAHFENGVVYWKRNAEFAYAIKYSESWPRYVKGTAEGQYEYSRLGYPNGPRVELIKYTKSDGTIVPGGVVQSFEGGSIYWQEDPAIGDGYIVAGGIKPLYASLGYEGGALGWPTGEEKLSADKAYVTQTFAHGTVIWHLSTGSAIVISTGGEVIYPKA